MNRREFITYSAALLSSSAVVSFLSPDLARAVAAPKKGGTLIWGHSDSVQNIDIHQTGAASSLRVLQNIHASIVTVDSNFNIMPGLAERFEISSDGLTYTFHLRQGILFHNGAAMTSADVKYSFDRIRDPATGAVNLEVFNSVKSIETPDAHTVVVNLDKVYAPFLARLSENGAGAVIPVGSGGSQGTSPVGAGPFKFVKYEPGHELEMERFDDYWEGPSYLDRLVAKEITEPTVRLTGLQTGEFQLINEVPPDRLDAFKADSKFRSLVWTPSSWDFVNFNHDLEPFKNKNVRLAMDLIIDKETLLQGALWGQGDTTASPSYPKSPARNPSLRCRGQDIEQAKKLLAEAGYGPGTLKLEFKVANNYPYQIQAAQIMVEWFGQAGIEMTIQQLTWSDWLSQVWVNKDFQMTMINVFAFWEPDFLYYGIWHSKGIFNFRHIKDPVVDQLVEEARVTVNSSTRNELYAKIQQRIFDEILDVVLWFDTGSIGAQANVGGLESVVHPNGSNLNFHKVWLGA